MLEPQETDSWRAFQLTTDALRDIDAFADRPERTLLLNARHKLAAAVEEDPKFMRATYYGAIVDDLLGEPKRATETLEALVKQQPAFQHEAEYNLAVSYYHQYHKDEIGKAIDCFQHVIRTASDPGLRLLSRAGLIRCSAMMVLHAHRTPEATTPYEQALSESDAVLADIPHQTPPIDRKVAGEIEWRVLNGRGVARMFHSDYIEWKPREKELRKAVDDFVESDKKSRDNWEIVCNLGSAHMRLGYVYARTEAPDRASDHYRQAAAYLTGVITRIRPDYGFALYEMGRLHRVQNRIPEALTWYARALAVPSDRRNVNDSTVEREIRRADAGDTSFPGN